MVALGYNSLVFTHLLASSTEFIASDLEVLPLPPPLVVVDVAYVIIRHAYCPSSCSFLP